SLLVQLAGSPAFQLAIADGQGGGDFTTWQQRAFAYAGDDLEAAEALFEDLNAEMRRRFSVVLEQTGHRNAWHTGPTPDFPLLGLVVDEAGVFLDDTMVKGDRARTAAVMRCRGLLGNLVRRSRSVLMWTLLLSQKPTGDQIPTALRDQAAGRL